MRKFSKKLMDKDLKGRELYLTYQKAIEETVIDKEGKTFIQLAERYAFLQFGYKKATRKKAKPNIKPQSHKETH